MNIRTIIFCTFIAVAAFNVTQPVVAGDSASQVAAGVVEVRVEGIASKKGTVYASIFLSAEGFPGDKGMAFAYRAVPAQDGAVLLRFEEVPAGEFVVAVLHDADENQELSFNLLGMPKEDYGFSRDARAMFGPPPFEKAAVSIRAGESKTLTVRVNKV
ncbi:MAG: DUF2141 domain-containing protein [Gammaproteobacteria bacterium]|nr:DUF2141 domain-containing protein [Gammaproteobacteria bacterium]